ncbi:MAG: hypothetical protein ACO1OQ_07425 [Rufibacter sp.]
MIRQEALPRVTTSAVSGIAIASTIRVFLFLAAWGVVSKGLVLDQANPTALVFQLAAGTVGYKLFGVVMVSSPCPGQGTMLPYHVLFLS